MSYTDRLRFIAAGALGFGLGAVVVLSAVVPKRHRHEIVINEPGPEPKKKGKLELVT